MIRRAILSAIAVFISVGAWASEPGQPLDGTDWVTVLPGLSARVYPLPPNRPACNWDPTDPILSPVCTWQRGASTDAEGNTYWLKKTLVATGSYCDAYEKKRSELYRFRRVDASIELVAYVEERCTQWGVDYVLDEVGMWDERPDGRINVDVASGVLRLWMRGQGSNAGPFPSNTQTSVVEVSGFTTLYEVQQSYTPQANTIGFRVPYMPEGLGGADRFDTYWGTLTHPIDFTQAHGLQCAYPSTPAALGDYLTVADTLPTPSPGQGYYYVTAATYQGQTRYGRKTTAGTLTGRDPALLPTCTTEVKP